jgi:hypothetical protein
VPNAVVDGSNQKRGAITVAATASGKGRGGDEDCTTKGVLTRSTGRPGRAPSTKKMESWCHPGIVAGAVSWTVTRRPTAARPVFAAIIDLRGRRRSLARYVHARSHRKEIVRAAVVNDADTRASTGHGPTEAVAAASIALRTGSSDDLGVPSA